jgi:putative redox protein
MEFKMNEHSFSMTSEFGELHISGDDQFGFRPFQLLVSSIAVCSGGVLRKVLLKKRIDFEDINIKADIERNPAQANRVEKIHLQFVISAKTWDERKIHKALEVTRKNCPIVQSVKDSIEVTETAEWRKI